MLSSLHHLSNQKKQNKKHCTYTIIGHSQGAHFYTNCIKMISAPPFEVLQHWFHSWIYPIESFEVVFVYMCVIGNLDGGLLKREEQNAPVIMCLMLYVGMEGQ